LIIEGKGGRAQSSAEIDKTTHPAAVEAAEKVDVKTGLTSRKMSVLTLLLMAQRFTAAIRRLSWFGSHSLLKNSEMLAQPWKSGPSGLR
jgi:hypothetical protein